MAIAILGPALTELNSHAIGLPGADAARISGANGGSGTKSPRDMGSHYKPA